MRDKFSLVRWLALAILFAGLLLVFFTDNLRWSTFFNFVASLLICFDLYVLASPPKLSLLHPADDPKPKFRLSPLQWAVFALVLIGCSYGIYGSHIRLSALLMMSALSLAAFDQYRRTNLNRVARD
jgi:uncharacterized membrane protein YfcA